MSAKHHAARRQQPHELLSRFINGFVAHEAAKRGHEIAQSIARSVKPEFVTVEIEPILPRKSMPWCLRVARRQLRRAEFAERRAGGRKFGDVIGFEVRVGDHRDRRRQRRAERVVSRLRRRVERLERTAS